MMGCACTFLRSNHAAKSNGLRAQSALFKEYFCFRTAPAVNDYAVHLYEARAYSVIYEKTMI